MKKLLSGIVAIALLLGLATSVNAATVTATPATSSKGDTVTVTVKASKAVNGMEFSLNYDKTAFDFVSATSTIGDVICEDPASGLTVSSATKTGDSVVLTFKSKAEAAEAKFTVSDDSTFFDDKGDEIATETFATKEVAVAVKAEAAKEDEKTAAEDKKDDAKTAETAKEDSKDAKKVDENGKEITKLPQTGANVATIGGIVLAVIAGAVVLAKRN